MGAKETWNRRHVQRVFDVLADYGPLTHWKVLSWRDIRRLFRRDCPDRIGAASRVDRTRTWA